MSFWSSIKARFRMHSPWGGSMSGGLGLVSDWVNYSAGYPGTGYDYAAAAGDLRLNPVVMACIAWMARALPEAKLQVTRMEAGTGEENAVPKHPLPQLLKHPNPFTSGGQLWQQVILDWVPTGNAYLMKVRNGSGKILELWNIPEARLKPQWEPDGKSFISHYVLQVDGDPQRIPIEDVIHFRFGRHPQNDRLGWSPLLSGMREIHALNEGANYRNALLKNRAVAAQLVCPKDPKTAWTQDQAKQYEARWNSKFTGDGSGRTAFSNVPVDLLKVGFSPQEMDLGTMLNWDADTVCSLLGLSSMVVGISSGQEHKTYANFAEALDAAWELCAIPTARAFAETLQLQLLPDLGNEDEETVSWDYSNVRALQEDQNALYARLTEAVGKKPWLAINEARAQISLPPMEGKDELEEEPPPVAPFGAESQGDRQAQAEQPAPRNGNGRQEAALNGNER